MGAQAEDLQFATVIVRYVTPVGEETHEIESNEFVVGRGQKADLSFIHSEISRAHFKVKVKDNKVYIEDLKSSNGTFINGVKLKPSVDSELKGTARVTFCPSKDYYFNFELQQESVERTQRLNDKELASLFSENNQSRPGWTKQNTQTDPLNQPGSTASNEAHQLGPLSSPSIPTPDPELVDLQMRIQKEREAHEELVAKNNKMQNLQSQLQDEIEHLQKTLDELKEDPRLKEQHKNLGKEVHRLNTERTLLVDEIDSLAVKLDDLMDNLDIQTITLKFLQSEST